MIVPGERVHVRASIRAVASGPVAGLSVAVGVATHAQSSLCLVIQSMVFLAEHGVSDDSEFLGDEDADENSHYAEEENDHVPGQFTLASRLDSDERMATGGTTALKIASPQR